MEIDVSMVLIGETPVKSKPIPLSPRSTSQNFIKHLGIVTVKEGRVDAVTSNSLNTAEYMQQSNILHCVNFLW